MKLRIVFIFFIIICGMFRLNAQHTQQQYINNPEYAKADADRSEREGDTSNAIRLYKIYGALSGKDVSSDIRRLELKSYPEWFDKSTMTAVSLKDDRVLIIYNQLRRSDAWELSDNNRVSGVNGNWHIGASDNVISNAIIGSGLYIPEEGIYSMSMRPSVSKDTKRTVKYSNGASKTFIVPDTSTSLIVYLVRTSGTYEIDCGNYGEKGEIMNNSYVKINKFNNKLHKIIPYYLFRILKRQNGKWIE